eukprot:6566368-Prymnesium_polylepis.1
MRDACAVARSHPHRGARAASSPPHQTCLLSRCRTRYEAVGIKGLCCPCAPAAPAKSDGAVPRPTSSTPGPAASERSAPSRRASDARPPTETPQPHATCPPRARRASAHGTVAGAAELALATGGSTPQTSGHARARDAGSGRGSSPCGAVVPAEPDDPTTLPTTSKRGPAPTRGAAGRPA